MWLEAEPPRTPMCQSVGVPFETTHFRSTRVPTVTCAWTNDERSAGTAQVTPAAETEVAETAVV